MLPEIFHSTRGASAFVRPPKKFQSGGLVRSRLPLCIGPRGAMVHHAFENFPKHARDFSIFEASKKISKREACSASPSALHRRAGGNGPSCFPKFSETRAGRRNFGSSQKKSEARISFGIASRFGKACAQQFAATISGILGNTRGALWRPSKARRSRFVLCAWALGAMIDHVSRYFLKTFVRRLANQEIEF